MASTLPLNYRGMRHARLTASMLKLPRIAQCVLTKLRYLIPDGESRAVSTTELARHVGISRGYASAVLRYLAGEGVSYFPNLATPPAQPFILRTERDDGPGHLITVLPPPETARPRSASAAPRDDSSGGGAASYEPPPAEQLSLWGAYSHEHLFPARSDEPAASTTDESPIDGAHASKHPILLHACTEQQHAQPAAAVGGDDDQDRETTAADAAEPPPAGVFPDAWQRMLIGTPDYTRAKFAEDLQVAHARGAGIGLIVRVRSAGQQLLSREDIYGPRRSTPPSHRRHPQTHAGRRTVPAAQHAPQPATPPGASLDDYALAPGSAEDWLRSLRAQRDVPAAAGGGAG